MRIPLGGMIFNERWAVRALRIDFKLLSMVHFARLNLHRHYVFDVTLQILIPLLALIEYRYRLVKRHG